MSYRGSRINNVKVSMKTIFLLMLCFSAHAIAGDCVTNRYGKVVCANDQKAVKVNPNTGTAATAEKNANGVTTTKNSKGATAKTKNGKGVYESPTGTKCVKTARQHGCN
jgi:predicted DNA-binding WGR domain protein